jgi:hypothetical protein
MSETRTKEELALTIDEAEWQWIKPHCERGALITVERGLELAEAGFRIAADDAATVGTWIAEGLIAKPTSEEIEAWDREPARRFPLLIISPYVLMAK